MGQVNQFLSAWKVSSFSDLSSNVFYEYEWQDVDQFVQILPTLKPTPFCEFELTEVLLELTAAGYLTDGLPRGSIVNMLTASIFLSFFNQLMPFSFSYKPQKAWMNQSSMPLFRMGS